MPGPNIRQLLTTALTHHQAGRLAEAETSCRTLMTIMPDQPDALARTLLGEARSQDLDTALAIGSTRTIKLPAPLPVYVVYLTAEPDPSVSGGLAIYRDIYHRD